MYYRTKYLYSYMYLYVYFHCNIKMIFIHFIIWQIFIELYQALWEASKMQKFLLDTYPKETQCIDLITRLSFTIDFL